VNLAPEQLIDGLVDRLADDVPAGHLQAAHHAHEREIRPQAEAGSMALAPHRLDTERIAAGEAAGEQILDHRGDDLRAEGRRVDLPDAFDPAGGLQLQEHEVPAPVARGRVAHDEYLYMVEFHGSVHPS